MVIEFIHTHIWIQPIKLQCHHSFTKVYWIVTQMLIGIPLNTIKNSSKVFWSPVLACLQSKKMNMNRLWSISFVVSTIYNIILLKYNLLICNFILEIYLRRAGDDHKRRGNFSGILWTCYEDLKKQQFRWTVYISFYFLINEYTTSLKIYQESIKKDIANKNKSQNSFNNFFSIYSRIRYNIEYSYQSIYLIQIILFWKT